MNSQFIKTNEVALRNLEQVTCLAIDSQSKYIFVGTRNGLVQAYKTDFEVATEIFTFSTYMINNIELHSVGQDIYMVLALSSGQVSLYKSVVSNFTVSQNHRKEHYTIQR